MQIIEKRAFNLLQFILSSNSYSVDKAMNQLNCTKRQLSYDLAKINDLMVVHQIEPIRISKDIFVITDCARQELQNLELTGKSFMIGGENKVWLICIMIFCTKEPLGLSHFMADFKSSKNTVLNDLKKLTVTAEQYKVQVLYTRKSGYHFSGNPRNIRTLVLSAISKMKDNYLCRELIGLALGDDKYPSVYAGTEDTIREFITEFNLPVINDYRVQSIFFISILPYHCESLFYEPVSFREHLWVNLPLYHSVKTLIEHFSGGIPEEETEYLFILILSMTLGYEAYFQVYSHESEFLKCLSTGLTGRFESMTGAVFRERARVEENLTMHLQAAYFRLKCGIPVVNPALEQLKKDYGDILPICRLVLEPFADYIDCFLPDDEIGYIAMHFLAMIDPHEPEKMQKRAVIVCQNGLGSAVMLKNQLLRMFPEILFLNTYNMEEFYRLPKDTYDIIFSTLDEVDGDADKFVFVTPPIMTMSEKVTMSERVYSEVFGIISAGSVTANSILNIVSDYAHIFDKKGLTAALNNHLNKKYSIERKDGLPVIKDLLTKETIRFAQGVSDWKEAIRLGAKPLIDNGSIDENYVSAMINNVEEHGPYIVICPHIAIPHAQNKIGVHKLGMSFLKLQNEVCILEQPDKPVKVFITLAAIDSNTHLKALAQLSELLNESEGREQLIACESSEEVIGLLEQL